MNKKAEALRKKLAPLQNELYEIERKEKKAKHRALVGKCFKFRNSYSGDSHWWLYAKIIRSGEYWPEAFAFQVMAKGEIHIEPNYSGISISARDGSWVEVERSEYDEAWRGVQAALKALKP